MLVSLRTWGSLLETSKKKKIFYTVFFEGHEEKTDELVKASIDFENL